MKKTMLKQQNSENTIVEVREELMIDQTSTIANVTPILRTAHFLKPTLPSKSTILSIPKTQTFSQSSKPNVYFYGNSNPTPSWRLWVKNLQKIHEPTWRKAGIFDAIMASTYRIRWYSDLIFSLAEKWCAETNTFVFPWGEATVTLEDVMVLGGFSTLGDSVLSNFSLEQNVEHLVSILKTTHVQLSRIDHNVSHRMWQEWFMGKGGELEHVGFLTLWLTRHVFQCKSYLNVTRQFFSLAARLCCGAKIALAPAILASIYRDLTLLKNEIVSLSFSQYTSHVRLKLLAPLQLVQVWAWERFPSLRPSPRSINVGEPRLARWENLSNRYIDDIEVALDSSRETFQWRPYAMGKNWSPPRYYVDDATWVCVDSDEEWKCYARCLMVCQLIGFNCVEKYLPHRVAMQFGMDQDIPKTIHLSKASRDDLWLSYVMQPPGLKLYLPPRLHEGDVTSRYSKWWRTGRLTLPEDALICCHKRKRTTMMVKGMSKIFHGCRRGDWLESLLNSTCVRKQFLDFNLSDNTTTKSMEQSPTFVDIPATNLATNDAENRTSIDIPGTNLATNDVESPEDVTSMDIAATNPVHVPSEREMVCDLNTQMGIHSLANATSTNIPATNPVHAASEMELICGLNTQMDILLEDGLTESTAAPATTSGAIVAELDGESELNMVINTRTDNNEHFNDTNLSAKTCTDGELNSKLDEESVHLEVPLMSQIDALIEADDTNIIEVAHIISSFCSKLSEDEEGRKFNEMNIPADNWVIGCDDDDEENNGDLNCFLAICHDYELRISRLENDVSAFNA